jgi:hypothetical protein
VSAKQGRGAPSAAIAKPSSAIAAKMVPAPAAASRGDTPRPRPDVQSGDTSDASAAEAEEPMIWEASRRGISGAITEQMEQFRECYDGWGRLQPDLTGRIVAEFVIVKDPEDPARGKVTRVGVRDADFQHAFMEGCVLQVFQDLKFEPPETGAVTVNYQLQFSNEKKQAEEPGAGAEGE